MTNYEKKYNEALERAKELLLGNEHSNTIRSYFEHIFPELRESDDERIRKGLVKLLTVASEAYLVESTGIKKDSYLSWLEKQKENPKSADSIPADCVSSAKCEDRWHKVTDSLPDNPREVLCKDEAGNYFIGRYYVGEGWEISNYDDEDKPHHLNPPVSKWIDFPSEKQKEPKPPVDIDPCDASWDAYYQRGLNKGYELGLKAGRKEQKPAWSEEDEKNCNRIIRFLEPHKTFFPTKETKEEMQNWIKNRLKSLRPSWKPSEEQMEAFRGYIEDFQARAEAAVGGWNNFDVMIRLYEQLKKL